MVAGLPSEDGHHRMMRRSRGLNLEMSMRKHTFRNLTKVILIAGYCLLFWPMLVSAAQVTLQWDPGNPAPDGYRLYQSQTPQLYDYDNAVWSGADTQCTIYVDDDRTYYFVVRAYQGESESGNSNEVSISTGNPQPEENDNVAPAKPVSAQPEQDAVISLVPELVTGVFMDADGDGHAATRYQIATTSDFNALVMDYTTSTYLSELTVMDLILDPDTTYYWRVRFIDDRGGVSAWSDPRRFTTIDYAAAGDANGNGILDDQEMNTFVDLDRDGQDDRSQAGMVSLQTPDTFNPIIAIKRLSEGVRIAAVKGYGNQVMDLAVNQPSRMTGLISFKLYLDEGVSSASVAIYFSEPAPADARWYKYDPEAGWSVYPDAYFSSDRRYITLFLEDGGPGDQDGVRNGIIVDPSGLAFSSNPAGDGAAAGAGGSGGGGGCFITSAVGESGAKTPASGIVIALVALLFMAVAGSRIVKRF
jgi:chitinase